MKESMWGYWIIILGVSIISIMILLQSYSTSDEQTYFLAKESIQSAMKEAVDYAYHQDSTGIVDGSSGNCVTGILKMNSEKFVENFIRRFSDTVDISKSYEINFYYLSEVPPAASVEVKVKTSATNFGQNQGANADDVTASTRFTGILVTTSDFNPCPI